MGLLTKLRTLDITFNDMSGTLPTDIGSMSRLESLWLSENSLSGQIPSEIGTLATLKVRLFDNLWNFMRAASL